MYQRSRAERFPPAGPCFQMGPTRRGGAPGEGVETRRHPVLAFPCESVSLAQRSASGTTPVSYVLVRSQPWPGQRGSRWGRMTQDRLSPPHGSRCLPARPSLPLLPLLVWFSSRRRLMMTFVLPAGPWQSRRELSQLRLRTPDPPALAHCNCRSRFQRRRLSVTQFYEIFSSHLTPAFLVSRTVCGCDGEDRKRFLVREWQPARRRGGGLGVEMPRELRYLSFPCGWRAKPDALLWPQEGQSGKLLTSRRPWS